MAFSGLGLPLTGFANHLYQFDEMTTARHAWMTAHNFLATLFVASAIWHVVLNRRALWNHRKGLAAPVPLPSLEALLAFVTVGGLTALFVGHAFHLR
jgi:hypothetical protein